MINYIHTLLNGICGFAAIFAGVVSAFQIQLELLVKFQDLVGIPIQAGGEQFIFWV